MYYSLAAQEEGVCNYPPISVPISHCRNPLVQANFSNIERIGGCDSALVVAC